jgi:5-methylcytosine-specific restriction endonuclease McrA
VSYGLTVDGKGYKCLVARTIDPKYDNRFKRHRRKAAVWRIRPHTCMWCHKPLYYDTFTVEHLRPKFQGGTNRFDNLEVACRPCNTGRDHTVPDYMMVRTLTYVRRSPFDDSWACGCGMLNRLVLTYCRHCGGDRP